MLDQHVEVLSALLRVHFFAAHGVLRLELQSGPTARATLLVILVVAASINALFVPVVNMQITRLTLPDRSWYVRDKHVEHDF
jgi:hypothetical protein